MPSTDIDGSTIVILSVAEAERVHHYLQDINTFGVSDDLDTQIARKIERDLNLEPINTARHP